jgi:hypothetical protein
MFTPIRVAVLLILAMILIVSAWSKLRFLDEDSDQPQRWRVEDYPHLPNAHEPGTD